MRFSSAIFYVSFAVIQSLGKKLKFKRCKTIYLVFEKPKENELNLLYYGFHFEVAKRISCF